MRQYCKQKDFIYIFLNKMLHEGAQIRYSIIEALAPKNVTIMEKDVAKVWDN